MVAENVLTAWQDLQRLLDADHDVSASIGYDQSSRSFRIVLKRTTLRKSKSGIKKVREMHWTSTISFEHAVMFAVQQWTIEREQYPEFFT